MAKQKFNWDDYQDAPIKNGSNSFNWDEFEDAPQKSQAAPENASYLEHLRANLNALKPQKGQSGLETAGNYADVFNKIIEQTGLPSVAQGAFGSAIDAGRGIANLIPGVNIGEQPRKELFVEPHVGQTGEILGSIFGMGKPLEAAYQGIKTLSFLNKLSPKIKSLLKTDAIAAQYNKVPETIRSLFAGSSLGAAISPDNRELGGAIGAIPGAITGAKNHYNTRSVKQTEKALQEAMKHYESLTANENSTKALASHQFNTNNPEALGLKRQDTQKELQSLEQQHNQPINEDVSKALTPEEATQHQKNIEAHGKYYLGEGEPHSVHAAPRITTPVEGTLSPETGRFEGGLRQKYGRPYEKLKTDLSNHEIDLPKSVDLSEIEKTVASITSKYTSPEARERFLNQLTKAAHKNAPIEKVNAGEFLDNYRELKHQADDAFNNAYQYGNSPATQKEWLSEGKKLKDSYVKMEKILESQLGVKPLERLREINKNYAKHVAPLNTNKLYQELLEHGKTSKNFIESLSGKTPGNDILRQIIGKDPELQRLVIGQSFAKNPEKLLTPNKLSNEYISKNPELSKLIFEQQKAKSDIEQAEKKAGQMAREIQINNTKQQIKQMDKTIKELEYDTKVKDLSKEEVDKRKDIYNKAVKKRAALKNRLIGSAITGGGIGYYEFKHRKK